MKALYDSPRADELMVNRIKAAVSETGGMPERDDDLAAAFKEAGGDRWEREAMQRTPRASGAIAYAFFRAGIRYARLLAEWGD